jgi:rod shape-determining protein MreC
MFQKSSHFGIKIFAALLIILMIIFLNLGGIFSPVRQFILLAIGPFQKTFYLISQGISRKTSFIFSISELRGENENMLKENNSLAREVAELKDIRRENETLREQLNLAPRKDFETEAAFVIGQDPEKLGSWLLIDKGSNNGIKEGMPVIVSDGVLVGKVSEAYFSSAKVILLSDPSMVVNVTDLETGARGVAKGNYGLGITMDLVEQAEKMNKGDTIITSGLGGSIPRGFFIGKVQEIKLSEDKLFQQASINPRVKYSRLDVVFAVKK